MLRVIVTVKGKPLEGPSIVPGHYGSLSTRTGFILFGCHDDDTGGALWETEAKRHAEIGPYRAIDPTSGDIDLLHEIGAGETHRIKFLGPFGLTTLTLIHEKPSPSTLH